MARLVRVINIDLQMWKIKMLVMSKMWATIKLKINLIIYILLILFTRKMCLDCIKQTCCDIVTIDPDELDKVRNMHENTRRFLVKRKTIMECLQTMMGLVIIIDVVMLILTIVTSLGVVYSNNGLELAIIGTAGILASIILAIILVVSYVCYHFIKLWHNSWYNYKDSIVYSKYLAFMIYVAFPLTGLLFAISNGDVAVLLIKVIGIIIITISTIHTFILKSNTLIKEISNSYEYKIISRILKIVYIPIAVIILGIICVSDPRIITILFAISYIVMISISTITDNPINKKMESGSSIICVILIIIIGIVSSPGVLGIMLGTYVNYVINSVIVVDLMNEWIMNNRTGPQDSNEVISQLMKDTGFEIVIDSAQLIPQEDKKDNDSSSMV